MPEVAERARAIAEAVDIPLLIDGETGYGGPRQIERAVRRFERAGAAAIRFEDRLPQAAGRQSMPVAAMVEKIKAAADARSDEALALVIRCDARESESFEQMAERLARYVEAGADAGDAQLSSVEEFRRLGSRPPAPLVSHWPRNLLTAHEFLALGYKIALVPSSVAIAATAAARALLLKLKETGDEKSYFQEFSDIEWVQSWYGELGKKKGKP
jgi:2-methylisocitrate lyase-like PEP mutase family enzyme